MNTNPEPAGSVFTEYLARLRAFRPNARYYLVSVLVTGATMGVYRLLFNFYVLSLGFDEALLGNLITTGNFTALILALPLGYLVDRWGRKQALLLRTMILGFAVGMNALFPSVTTFFAMNALFGVAQALSAVAMGPFLMENSGEQERTYLFSFGMGIQMASVFVGTWVGGYLPTWIGAWRAVEPTSSAAYAGALLVVAVLGLFGLLPLSFILPPSKVQIQEGGHFAPFIFAKENPKLLGKVFFPLLLISIGAGMFVPFLNVFFRVVHFQPDHVIGSIMAWGSLAMGVGLILAPPLADRIGKIRLVVLTQGLSIPFMVMLGFAPWFLLSAAAYYVRMALMNMSNPIYQNFVLENVDPDSRGTVASLYSMIWSFGRAFSPSISGALQVSYGFAPPFLIAIVLYAVAITLQWAFFMRGRRAGEPITLPLSGT